MATIMTPDFKRGFAIGLSIGGVEITKENGIRLIRALELSESQIHNIDLNFIENFEIPISSLSITSGANLQSDGTYYTTMQKGKTPLKGSVQNKFYNIYFEPKPLSTTYTNFNATVKGGGIETYVILDVVNTNKDCKKNLYIKTKNAIEVEGGGWVGNNEETVEIIVTNSSQDIGFTIIIQVLPAVI